MDIPAILDKIRHGAAWAMLGENKGDYNHLDWRDDVQTKPTLGEIENAWPSVERQIQSEKVRDLREQKHPEVGDVIDALFKKLDEGDSTEWDALAQKRREIKSKYPKA